MFSVGKYRVKIYDYVREFVNCWLEYMLSQPVDIDITVLFHFTKSYIGIPVILSFYKRMVLALQLLDKEPKEGVEELVPQESYS